MTIKKLTAMLLIIPVIFISGCSSILAKTDKQIIKDYFRYAKLEMPNKGSQEMVLEALFNLNYDIIFDDISDVWGDDYSNSIGLHVTYYGDDNEIVDTEIWIDTSLRDLEFGFVYAHELSHGLGIIDEAMTNFNAFITMWESEIPYLRYQSYCGIQFMFGQPDEYNCIDLLLEYVEEN